MRPMVRIIRQGVLTMYDMVKRYTGLILKEINDRADDNKTNESNVVAAKE
jgi:hypothetical protein